MTMGLLLGALFGGALCLLLYALVPPRPGLGSAITRWERQRARQSVVASSSRDAQLRQVGQQLDGWLAGHGVTLGKLKANLVLTDTTLETHLVKKFAYGLLGLLLPSVTALVVALLGSGGPSLTLPAVAGLGLGALLFWIPDLEVTRVAEQRRTELRRGLSCYLDLVSMSLAGGRGLPETLPSCAQIGSRWAFETIQDTISRARYTGSTPWQAFEELGERTNIQELQDLGGALTLVADDGAKVRETLAARAATQRQRQLAEAEGAAATADQTIQMAQIVLAVGFFLFLGYPALIAVLQV